MTNGAHLKALDQNGHAALTQAALDDNVDAMAFLASAGADTNAHAETNHQTPLMAILSGWAMGLWPRSTGLAAKEEEPGSGRATWSGRANLRVPIRSPQASRGRLPVGSNVGSSSIPSGAMAREATT